MSVSSVLFPAKSQESEGKQFAGSETEILALLANCSDDEALELLDKSVKSGKKDPQTLLNLAIAEEKAGDPERALSLFQEVCQAYPASDEAALRLAEYYRHRLNFDEAIKNYRRVLTLNPLRREALLALSALLLERNFSEEVIPEIFELTERALRLDPNDCEALNIQGLLYVRQEKLTKALDVFEQICQAVPSDLDAALYRAGLISQIGDKEAALNEILQKLDKEPLNPVWQSCYGFWLLKEKNYDKGIEALMLGCRLIPSAFQVRFLLLQALMQQGRLAEAEKIAEEGLKLDPLNSVLQNFLGVLLFQQLKHAESREVLTKMQKRVGLTFLGSYNLSNSLNALGLQEEGVELARAMVQASPEDFIAQRSLASALPYCQGIPAEEITEAFKRCAVLLPFAAKPPDFSAYLQKPAGRRLKVGFLSGNFRVHPATWLTVAGLEKTDKALFEFHFFSLRTYQDFMVRRLKEMADGWYDVLQESDEKLAEFIRSKEIDILVDLGGYGDGGQIGVYRFRPAPVQIKWVGAQYATTGLPEMDWYLGDYFETPDETAHLYTERLLRVKGDYVCYDPPVYAPEVNELPALKNGFITFGCFNNLAKVTSEVLATWAEILERLPTAHFLLKTHQFSEEEPRARIKAFFAERGIAPERLILDGVSPHSALLGCYNRADVILDPFPYTGGLTTCEALYMGVPVITLVGQGFAARHSYTHLMNVGLEDRCCFTREAYIERAVREADDLQGLAKLRRELRTRMSESPLCQAKSFAREFEQALMFSWQDFVQRQEKPVKTGS